MATSVLNPKQIVRPEIDTNEVIQLTETIFGLQVLRYTELNSYDDRNFHIHVKKTENKNISKISSEGYVLKVLNCLDSEYDAAIEAQNSLMVYLNDNGINTPKPMKTVVNETKSIQKLRSGKKHIVRLFEYIPGRILAGIPFIREIAFQTGQLAGKLDKYCQNFNHPGFGNHRRIWSLTEVPKLVEFLSYTEDLTVKTLCKEVINMFTNNVVAKYHTLQKGLIHGDFNEQNIMVNQTGSAYHVSGILDFGDAADSYYIFEVAIAMCCMMLESTILDPMKAGGYTLAGYLSEFPLNEVDLNVLKECICARLVQSLIIGTYSTAMHPENSSYFQISSKNSWEMLINMWNTPKEQMNEIWKECLVEFGVKFSWK